jgi:hypothetical protein
MPWPSELGMEALQAKTKEEAYQKLRVRSSVFAVLKVLMPLSD